MEHVLEREDRQEELTKGIKSLVKEIEGDDLKVVTFMEYTSPPKEVKPKVIKFNKALELLRLIAKQGKVEEGVAKIMFYSPSTERSRGLTPTMMAGLQYIEPGVSTKPHSHNMASIYLVVKGKGYSIIDGEKYYWEEGDIFVVPANAVHSHVNTSGEEVVLFDVTDSGLLENLGILEFKEE
ncbi:cupin domain-containing protein [Acidianus sp. HS-5]|uniref:cupin domain-containing protein n=1 Tax=Acidianus sp. HS-5 TaxID=2886040 RepID=UPI001F307190|nr:cupin domain-containing protein [Acidianus sp. HS-5]BDC19607.1 cupin [Acidianus sp. HS-5]